MRHNDPPGAAYDVVIAGGGMVGSLLACALGGSALKVAVLERDRPAESSSADYDRRVSALTLASRTMLEAVGAWPSVQRRRYAEIRAMRVWDAIGAGEIHFNALDIGEPSLGIIVENRVVVAALYERMAQHTNVHVIAGAEIKQVTAGAETSVVLHDGRRLQASLLVAADGADSLVRQQLSIPLREMDLRQRALVATVHTERPHEATAWQRFLPTGPLAFLPLPEPHVCSIVWSLDEREAEARLRLDDTAFAQVLGEAFMYRLGVIRHVSARSAFPLALSHVTRYVGEGVALIGDAAHTVHPLAGQGVNLGMLDAAALAEVVLDAAHERRPIGARHVLRRYERWRKGDNLAMVAVTGGFKFLFGNEWPGVSQLRGAGLAAANALTPIKNFIMRQASGLQGDLPRLARRGAATNL
jgi:2-polyprenylphenol 6-hydroxylase